MELILRLSGYHIVYKKVELFIFTANFFFFTSLRF